MFGIADRLVAIVGRATNGGAQCHCCMDVSERGAGVGTEPDRG